MKCDDIDQARSRARETVQLALDRSIATADLRYVRAAIQAVSDTYAVTLVAELRERTKA